MAEFKFEGQSIYGKDARSALSEVFGVGHVNDFIMLKPVYDRWHVYVAYNDKNIGTYVGELVPISANAKESFVSEAKKALMTTTDIISMRWRNMFFSNEREQIDNSRMFNIVNMYTTAVKELEKAFPQRIDLRHYFYILWKGALDYMDSLFLVRFLESVINNLAVGNDYMSARIRTVINIASLSRVISYKLEGTEYEREDVEDYFTELMFDVGVKYYASTRFI